MRQKKKFWRTVRSAQPSRRVIENCAVIIVGGLLGATALPSLLGVENKGCACGGSEAKNHIGAMGRAQQAYVLENQKFATSIADLEIGIPTQTQNYNYSLRSTPLYAIQSAKSRKAEKTGFVGIVAFAGRNSETGEWQTENLACETEQSTTTRPPEPTFNNGVLACPMGTKAYSYNEYPEITIRDRDFQIAYESLNLAEAGDLHLARKQADTIQDAKVKEKVWDAIAAVEP